MEAQRGVFPSLAVQRSNTLMLGAITGTAVAIGHSVRTAVDIYRTASDLTEGVSMIVDRAGDVIEYVGDNFNSRNAQEARLIPDDFEENSREVQRQRRDEDVRDDRIYRMALEAESFDIPRFSRGSSRATGFGLYNQFYD